LVVFHYPNQMTTTGITGLPSRTKRQIDNKIEILSLIPFDQVTPISNARLMDMTRLSQYTVKKNVEQLIADGLIQKVMLSQPRTRPMAHYFRAFIPPIALQQKITPLEPQHDFFSDLDPSIVFCHTMVSDVNQ